MPRPAIMYSEVLRRKPAPKKACAALPLKTVESNRIETKCPVPHTPISSSSSNCYVDDDPLLFPPGLPVNVVYHDQEHDHDYGLDLPIYAQLHMPPPNNISTANVDINRKASIDAVYIPPPPLAKPYVDKLLGPKSNVTSRKIGNAGSSNLNILPTFDPFTGDPEGSTRSPPPSYRLPLSELLPRKKSEPNDKATMDSSFIQPFSATLPTSIQGPNFSLAGLFLQHGVERSVYFLPPDLLDNDEEEESYPACSKSCLAHQPLSIAPISPWEHRDSNNRSPSSTGSKSSRSSSLVSRTDYSPSPTISSASSAYSEDYSFYHRRKPAAPKCCIFKFNSPDTIGVSLEAVLSKKKGCLTDPNDEVMEDWGEKGKPACIHLIITCNGFKRVFPIQIRCLCGVITRAELAYEIADIMQRYLVEAKIAKSRTDAQHSISGSYLLSLRTDNQGLSWRATFADRRRIKTNDAWGKTAQRR